MFHRCYFLSSDASPRGARTIKILLTASLFCIRSEPVGSKAPALMGIVKGIMLEVGAMSNVVIFCPAQGYPVPSFR